jgi:hypothetical protein
MTARRSERSSAAQLRLRTKEKTSERSRSNLAANICSPWLKFSAADFIASYFHPRTIVVASEQESDVPRLQYRIGLSQGRHAQVVRMLHVGSRNECSRSCSMAILLAPQVGGFAPGSGSAY